MFGGLMSRWTMPASCTAARPRQSCFAIWRPGASATTPRRSRMSRSVVPGTYSIVRKRTPSASPRSCVLTTLRCVILRASRISCLSVCVAPEPSSNASGRRTLSATSSSSSRSTRAVDGSHPALAEERRDLVAGREERPDARPRERPRRGVRRRDARRERLAARRVLVAADARDHLLERGLLLELADHRGERAGERADLAAARLGQRHVEVPLADRRGAARELLEGPRDAPSHRERDGQRDEERDGADPQERVANPLEGGRLLLARSRDDERAERLAGGALERDGAEDAPVARDGDVERADGPALHEERVHGGRLRREGRHERVPAEGGRRGGQLERGRLAAPRDVRDESRLPLRDPLQRLRARLVERDGGREDARETAFADGSVAREHGDRRDVRESGLLADDGRRRDALQRVGDPLHGRERAPVRVRDVPGRSGRGGRRARRRETRRPRRAFPPAPCRPSSREASSGP